MLFVEAFFCIVCRRQREHHRQVLGERLGRRSPVAGARGGAQPVVSLLQQGESESAPDPLTSGFPFRHDRRSGERGHDGNAISQVHGRVQAEGRRAVQEIGDHVRRGGARARMRPRQPVGLGEEGRRRRGARRKPVPDGRGPAQAEAREREAEEGERDTFKASAFFASRQL